MSLLPGQPCSPQSDQSADVCRSRWSGLYSDALHSILQFASLDGLSRVLSVCRRWSEAVTTMPPIQAESTLGGAIACFCRPDNLDDLLLLPVLVDRMRGPLARHVVSFGSYRPIRSSADLQLVAQSMPWMREVRIFSPMEPDSPEEWPAAIARFASLRSLSVDLRESFPPWGSAATNKLLAAIGVRATLETVEIELSSSFGSEVSFAPLIALHALRNLSVHARDTPDQDVSDAQIDELRAMTSVHTFSSSWADEGKAGFAFLTRMLQPGHALQWTTLPCSMQLREPLASLMGSLSSLTQLRATLHCPNMSCFSQLIHLTDVSVHAGPSVSLDLAALVASLSHCTALQSLTLKSFDLTSAHLGQLLSSFPQLSALSLLELPALDSLRFLATDALAQSLCSLSLWRLLACPAAESAHLLQLRTLERLSIELLATPLNGEQQSCFTLPSLRFPKLASVYVLDPYEPWGAQENQE